MLFTNDSIIRCALKEKLEKQHSKDKKVRIIEELRVQHGDSRVDIAVVNGIMHGYEIKSDLDTLQRLPEQVAAFSAIFDKMTIVVGKAHLYEAVRMVPEWWGITLAKTNINGSVDLFAIRPEEINKELDSISIARLLWRNEALSILEAANEAHGFRSKPRSLIYTKLSAIYDQKTLCEKVRETIFFRSDWRPDAPLMSNGD